MAGRPKLDVPPPRVEIRSDAPLDGCAWTAIVFSALAILLTMSLLLVIAVDVFL